MASSLLLAACGNLPDEDDAALWQDGLELSFLVLADVAGEFWPVWDPEGVLPVTAVIGPDGVVLWREAGGSEAELAGIESTVVAALP